MKTFVKKVMNLLGLEVIRKNPAFHETVSGKGGTTMMAAIRRSAARGLRPVTVFDVGAAEGLWTLDTMDVWPDSTYVLLEPLRERESDLLKVSQKNKKVHFVGAGAGANKGELDFYVTSDLDGSGIADNGSSAIRRKIQITTLDEERHRLGLKGPFVIKLDTHGYEVPILEGATNTLSDTELLIIECYGFRIAPGSLLFWEMCSYMEQKGFRLVDIADVMNRPKDHAFWQCDAFFVPARLPVFFSDTYH